MKEAGTMPVGVAVPSSAKIIAYLPRLRAQKQIGSVVTAKPTFETVCEFADKNLEANVNTTLKPDQPFVVGFDTDVSGEYAKFRLCITTYRLINLRSC